MENEVAVKLIPGLLSVLIGLVAALGVAVLSTFVSVMLDGSSEAEDDSPGCFLPFIAFLGGIYWSYKLLMRLSDDWGYEWLL